MKTYTIDAENCTTALSAGCSPRREPLLRDDEYSKWARVSSEFKLTRNALNSNGFVEQFIKTDFIEGITFSSRSCTPGRPSSRISHSPTISHRPEDRLERR